MSVAIKKVDGVETVKVSLNEGFADIKLKPANRVTVERIRGIIRDNGFTPKGSDIRVAGRLVERGGKPALAVSGLDLVYLLVDHPDARGKIAELQKAGLEKLVIVTGHLPETAKEPTGDAPAVLQLRDFAPVGE